MSSHVIRVNVRLEAPSLPSAALHVRAERAEMIACLTGSLSLLEADTSRIGRPYRDGLKARIRSILERERGK